MPTPKGATAPQRGELLYLIPRHVCPTVNNFDYALLAMDGGFTVVPVTARGREAPLPLPASEELSRVSKVRAMQR